MALPGNNLPNIAPAVALLAPDSLSRPSLLVDFERGGVGLQDPSQGLDVLDWQIDYVNNDVRIYPVGNPSLAVVIFNAAGITELSLSFDQNMRPLVAYVINDSAFLRWFDPVPNSVVTTSLAAGVRSPVLTMDDKRAFATLAGSNDVLLFYIRDGSLYYRQQRDRFDTERLLQSGLSSADAIRAAGMNVGNRVQVNLNAVNASRTVLSIHADSDPPQDSSCGVVKSVQLTGNAVFSTDEVKFGNGAYFIPNNGTSSISGLRVLYDHDFRFGTQDFTLELWAYKLNHTYQNTLFFSSNLGGGTFSIITAATTGQITVTYRSSGGTQTASNLGVFPLNQWVFVTLQRNGTSWEFCIDGTLVDTRAITGGAGSTVNSAADLFFGRTNIASTQTWNGYIDEIRITRGVARYSPPFVPNDFPNCDSTDPPVISTSGNERPVGQFVTVQRGSVTVQDPWVRLQGQQMTAARGNVTASIPDRTAALTGQQIAAITGNATVFSPNRTAAVIGQSVTLSRGNLAIAPYPNLTRISTSGAVAYIEALVPNNGFVCISYYPNGTIQQRYGILNQYLVLWSFSGTWINQNQGYNIVDIAGQYTMRPVTIFIGPPPTVTRTAPDIFMNTGVLPPLALPASMEEAIHFYWLGGSSYPKVQFAIRPAPNNPRYGETNYFHLFNYEHSFTVVQLSP